MSETDARETYEALTSVYDVVRDIWVQKVCPKCYGRRDPRDATEAWPKCECHPSTQG
jgi:hypothetical protein